MNKEQRGPEAEKKSAEATGEPDAKTVALPQVDNSEPAAKPTEKPTETAASDTEPVASPEGQSAPETQIPPEEAETQAISIVKAKKAEDPTGPEAKTQAIETVRPAPEEAPPSKSSPPAPRPAAARPAAAPRPAPTRIPPRAPDSSAARARPTPQARPQRVGPAPVQAEDEESGHGKWWAALIAAVVVIAAVAVGGYLLLDRNTVDNSPETQIRTEIDAFTQALSTGDLATLRTTTCGDLANFYRDISDTEFADVHRVAVEQGTIPVVQSVDAVQVTGDTAIAQVIAYTNANPNDRSPRTFDLALDNETWKVCA